MRKDRFEPTLHALRERPLPTCPTSLEADVLRRIRRAKGTGTGEWFGLSLPRSVLLLGALAIGFAASLATVALHRPAPFPDRLASARLALGFEAFSVPARDPLHD